MCYGDFAKNKVHSRLSPANLNLYIGGRSSQNQPKCREKVFRTKFIHNLMLKLTKTLCCTLPKLRTQTSALI